MKKYVNSFFQLLCVMIFEVLLFLQNATTLVKLWVNSFKFSIIPFDFELFTELYC